MVGGGLTVSSCPVVFGGEMPETDSASFSATSFMSGNLSKNMTNSKWGVWGNRSTGMMRLGMKGSPLYRFEGSWPKVRKFCMAALASQLMYTSF